MSDDGREDMLAHYRRVVESMGADALGAGERQSLRWANAKALKELENVARKAAE